MFGNLCELREDIEIRGYLPALSTREDIRIRPLQVERERENRHPDSLPDHRVASFLVCYSEFPRTPSVVCMCEL